MPQKVPESKPLAQYPALGACSFGAGVVPRSQFATSEKWDYSSTCPVMGGLRGGGSS